MGSIILSFDGMYNYKLFKGKELKETSSFEEAKKELFKLVNGYGLTEIKQELTSLRAKYLDNFAELYMRGILGIFSKYPTLESFSIGVKNHEFNDGDPTRFYITGHDPNITLTGEPDKEIFDDITHEIFSYYRAIDNHDLEWLYTTYHGEFSFRRKDYEELL